MGRESAPLCAVVLCPLHSAPPSPVGRRHSVPPRPRWEPAGSGLSSAAGLSPCQPRAARAFDVPLKRHCPGPAGTIAAGRTRGSAGTEPLVPLMGTSTPRTRNGDGDTGTCCTYGRRRSGPGCPVWSGDLSSDTPCSPADMRTQTLPSKGRDLDTGTHLSPLAKMSTPQMDMGPRNPSSFYRDKRWGHGHLLHPDEVMEMQLHSFTKGAAAGLVGAGGWQMGQGSGIPKCGASDQPSSRHVEDCSAGLASVALPSLGPKLPPTWAHC